MLLYFFRYDHLNYANWGSVFIAEMRQLPVDVLREFRKGNFVVKWSEGRFNQVRAVTFSSLLIVPELYLIF